MLGERIFRVRQHRRQGGEEPVEVALARLRHSGV